MKECKPIQLTCFTEKDKRRFFSKFNKGKPDECWQWKGKPMPKGYGRFSLTHLEQGLDTVIYAHRVSFALANGYDPAPMLVLHRCDNPTCVNPAHLFAGTYDDNHKDMTNKDRRAVGEVHGQASLLASQVEQIRERYAKERPTDSKIVSKLAAEFQISFQHVYKLVSGKRRKRERP